MEKQNWLGDSHSQSVSHSVSECDCDSISPFISISWFPTGFSQWLFCYALKVQFRRWVIDWLNDYEYERFGDPTLKPWLANTNTRVIVVDVVCSVVGVLTMPVRSRFPTDWVWKLDSGLETGVGMIIDDDHHDDDQYEYEPWWLTDAVTASGCKCDALIGYRERYTTPYDQWKWLSTGSSRISCYY